MQNLVTDNDNSNSPPDKDYLPTDFIHLQTGLPIHQEQDQVEDNQEEADKCSAVGCFQLFV